jgi:hypothetical protein
MNNHSGDSVLIFGTTNDSYQQRHIFLPGPGDYRVTFCFMQPELIRRLTMTCHSIFFLCGFSNKCHAGDILSMYPRCFMIRLQKKK